MSDGTNEYAALLTAMETTDPLCLDDDRFTAERHDLHPQELVHLRGTCRTCPLFDPCTTYATTARPPHGLWAGRYYPRKGWAPIPRKDTP